MSLSLALPNWWPSDLPRLGPHGRDILVSWALVAWGSIVGVGVVTPALAVAHRREYLFPLGLLAVFNAVFGALEMAWLYACSGPGGPTFGVPHDPRVRYDVLEALMSITILSMVLSVLAPPLVEHRFAHLWEDSRASEEIAACVHYAIVIFGTGTFVAYCSTFPPGDPVRPALWTLAMTASYWVVPAVSRLVGLREDVVRFFSIMSAFATVTLPPQVVLVLMAEGVLR